MGLFRPCLSDDEATYCVVGREMLSGRTLYFDVVDHKPPLIYLTYAATQALGGPTGGMRLLHLLTALVVFATSLLIGRIARDRGPGLAWASVDDRRTVSFFAAALYVVFSTTLFDVDAQAANCELFMMLPLTASVLVYLHEGERRLRWLSLSAAGALVAIAALYKYQAAIQIPLYALHLTWVERRRPMALMVGLAAMLAGLAAVSSAAVAIAHLAGAWGGAWFWFRFNFAYIKQGVHLSELLPRATARISYAVLPALFLWIPGLRAAPLSLRRPLTFDDPQRTDLFLTGWLLVSALAVTAGGRFFGHYFHQTTAPLSVLAAPAAVRLARTRPRLVGAAVGIPTAVFFLLGVMHSQLMAAAGAPIQTTRPSRPTSTHALPHPIRCSCGETRPCSTSKPVDRSAAGSCSRTISPGFRPQRARKPIRAPTLQPTWCPRVGTCWRPTWRSADRDSSSTPHQETSMPTESFPPLAIHAYG